jgi:competence protein ComEA
MDDDLDDDHDDRARRSPVLRTVLSTRAVFIAAGVIALVALVVVLAGARTDRRAAVSTVTGAPAVPAGGAAVEGASDGRGAGIRTGGPTASATSVPLVVDVAGAVTTAGVYSLPQGDRVQDALDAAGGAADDADLVRLNLARVLVDGERLYVPRVGEGEVPQVLDPDGGGASVGVGGGGGGGGGGQPGTGGAGGALVDLNTADQAALETLPGIGPALAMRIIAWRTEHGGFRSPDDLLDVSGIGDARFADLEPLVRV